MDEKFCSIRSKSANENLYGTAPFFDRILLLEYDRPMGTKAVHDSELSDEIKVYFNRSIDTKVFNRVLLIKKGKISQPGKINVFAVENSEEHPYINHFVLDDYSELPDLDLFAEDAEKYDGPLYCVCTNGKKDQCCSKFGLPIYQELKNLDADVWQCSHIGGDRFAPNVINFPYSHFYGHLRKENMPEFLETTQNGEIFFSNYRGRSCYEFKTQGAVNYLRAELDDYKNGNINNIGSEVLSPDLTSVKLLHKPTGNKYDITVRMRVSEETYRLTCKAVKASPVRILSCESIERID